MDLNNTAKMLDVAKRRIYDITNVLEGIGLLEKCSKNTIKWKGSGKKLDPAHELEQTEIMARIKALRGTDRSLDAHINAVYEQIQQDASIPGNKELIYVTAEETQTANLYCDKTMIAIQAPTQTVLEVPDPDEHVDGIKRYHVYMKSTNGPIHTHVLNSNNQTTTTTTSVASSPSAKAAQAAKEAAAHAAADVAASSISSFSTSPSSTSSSSSSSSASSSSFSSARPAKKKTRSAQPQLSTMAAYKQVRRHANVGVSSNYKKVKAPVSPVAPLSPAIMPLPAGEEDFSYGLGADEGIVDFF